MRERVARILRVVTFALVVAVVVSGIAVKRARAKAADGALLFGEHLLSASAEGVGSELVVNGQRLYVSNAQTNLPLRAVLDRFEAQCEEHADGMSADLAHLDEALSTAPAAEGFPGIGVLRDDRNGRGVVACFAAGAPTDHASLASRLSRFAETHDLADVGELRYVAARTLDSGVTQVAATWTTGALRLDEMFPEHGDARGEDPSFAPRPASSTRVLSARDGRVPYGVFLYEMPASTENALLTYEAAAREHGFSSITEAADRETHVLTRSTVDVVVTAARHDGRTFLSIVEMPARPVRR